MIRYINLASNCLKTFRPINSPLLHTRSTWLRTSQIYASDSKRKGPFSKKTNLNNAKSTTLLQNTQTTKIVQIRTNTTNHQTSASPIRPSFSFPYDPKPLPELPSRPSSSLSSPPSKRPPDNPKAVKRFIITALIALGSVVGMYYMGWLDLKNEAPKKFVTRKKEQKPKWKPRPVLRYPLDKEQFPERVPYVLIGGGTASFAAFRAIKSMDPTAKVLVISAEDSIPYMRPPLSKEMWQQKELPPIDNLTFLQWNGQERSLYYEPAEFYLDIQDLMGAEHGGVTLATGWVVSKVEASTNTLILEDPKTETEFSIRYDKCLIATGSTPKKLPLFEEAPQEVKDRTILLRNIRDLEGLWYKLEEANSVAIVGGGFLGSELACSLGRRFKAAKKGEGKVYQLFREPGNMGKVLPEYLSKWTTLKVADEGVNVVSQAEVQNVKMDNNQVSMSLSNGETIKADVVVVAVGSEPCTHLAETSDLELDPKLGGFLVNAELEARSNLFVAGDASCFYDPVLGRRRVEHHDHAVVSGRLAGENMAGAAKPYKHQSMFWSDLGPDVGYEAIGIIDSELPTVAVFDKKSEAPPTDDNHSTIEAAEADVNPILNTSEIEAEPIKSILDEDRPAVKSEKPEEVLAVKSEKSEEIPKETVVVNSLNTDTPQSENDYSKGVIFYLKNEVIVGIILWNVFNRMHTARRVLAEKKKYEDLNEVAKLFNIHEN